MTIAGAMMTGPSAGESAARFVTRAIMGSGSGNVNRRESLALSRRLAQPRLSNPLSATRYSFAPAFQYTRYSVG
jgi:hypothetical protein